MSYPNDRSREPDSNHAQNRAAHNSHNGTNGDYPGPSQYPDPEPEMQQLRREEVRVAGARRATIATKITQSLMYLVGALELLLAVRFVLRLTAANPDNTFADFIYNLSQPFVNPFSTLFISPTFNGSEYIFDVNVLVAMAAYLILLFLAIWQIRILTNR